MSEIGEIVNVWIIFLCTQSNVPFYYNSPRLSPGVLSVMQYANAPLCSKQEKALWM